MVKLRKICVVTGTRAEYGLLQRLMGEIRADKDLQLQIVATGMHLSAEFGLTYKEIEKDGFTINWRIPIIDDDDTDDSVTTIKSMAKALNGFADAFNMLKPDIVVVLGDRYEILAAAEAALIERIPIAHIHGGEITEGAFDDAIRHSITKMSHLHFTSTEEYRKRVIQLGEQPDRVFYVGALGVQNIKTMALLAQSEIENEIGFLIDKHTLLVTYHPVTLGDRSAMKDIADLLTALDSRKDLRIIFTMPNSDAGGRAMADAIDSFVSSHPDRAKSFRSLGVKRYLSVMKYVAAVVGNSSSGVLEAPSLGVPTLNIGDRQHGRIAAESVLNCAPDTESILAGLEEVLSKNIQELAVSVRNPYEKEHTAEEIFKVISTYPLEALKTKHFYDIRS